MLIGRFVAWTVLIAVSGTGVVYGQIYPTKPLRIVTAGVGGGNDFAARLIAQGISAPLGQQVIVDNRSATAPETVSRAEPDGYTVLYYGSALWIRPLLRDMPFDPVRDFSPITYVGSTPNVLVAHPSVPVKSVKELVALAKLKAGGLNYSSGGPGSPNHIAAELFKAMAEVNIVRISYKGTGPAVNGLIVGEVQVMFAPVASVEPHFKSGRLRALAVTSVQPSALAPGLPTVAAALPGYEAISIYGMFAPAKTPATIIKRLNQEIVRFLKTPEANERFLKDGIEIVAGPPQQLTASMKSEMARAGKVIKDVGIRDE